MITSDKVLNDLREDLDHAHVADACKCHRCARKHEIACKDADGIAEIRFGKNESGVQEKERERERERERARGARARATARDRDREKERVSPVFHVDGRFSAAHRGLVNDVIVHQARRVYLRMRMDHNPAEGEREREE